MRLVYKVQGQHLTKTGLPPLELAIDKAAMEADIYRMARLDGIERLTAEAHIKERFKLTSIDVRIVSEYEQRAPKAQDKPQAT